MKKLSTLKAALEKEGLQIRLAALNNVNGPYPDKECNNKHALARKIGKGNFNYEERGHYSALFITERNLK